MPRLPSSRPPLEQIARALEDLVATQLRRIRRRFALHGFGWTVAALCTLALLYYVADRSLNLPPAVRVLLSLGVLAYLAHTAQRRLLYPLSRSFHRDDIAVAIERRFPELEERLISAVQLEDMVRHHSEGAPALRNQSAAMISALVEDTADAVQRLPHQKLLDPRATLRLWSVAASAALALCLLSALQPEAFGVFLQRVFGSSAAYPRRTTLVVELPENSPQYLIARDGRTARITMAEGDELPVLVRAEGVVPREVFLVVAGGRGMAPHTAMAARGPAVFRHVFRRVSSSFSFHASGGDDDSGDLDVEVVTVRPPTVQTIRCRVTPPAYTRLDPVTLAGGAMEALEGSRVQIEISATTAVRDARLTFLESGREVALAPETITDDEGTHEILAGTFTVERSDRYQVQLVSPDGLENPHPGIYPIAVVADHAPAGRILSPSDDGLGVVLPTGIIPLRLEATDDYGLVTARALVQVSKVESAGVLDLLPAAPEKPVLQLVVTRLIDVAALPIQGASASVGETVSLAAELIDNREPAPLSTAIPGRQVHVVGAADLARRVAGQFRRIREDVEGQLELEEKLQERLAEAIERMQQGATLESLRADLTEAQVDQARLQSRTARTQVEFMRAFDLHLFNRLEESPHAERVLELYVGYHREHPAAEEFLPGFYRMLDTERREGRLGAMAKFLDPILDMTLSCARIADELAPATVRIVETASVAESSAAAGEALAEGARLQHEIIAELQRLLERLKEWNEFQDVIIHTRSLLEKQREIQIRTRDAVRPREGGEAK